jgi:hypothetical protein
VQPPAVSCAAEAAARCAFSATAIITADLATTRESLLPEERR